MYRSSYERMIEIAGQSYSSGAGNSEIEKRLLRYLVRSRTLREIREYRGYSVFLTKAGAAVVVVSSGQRISRQVKSELQANELLIVRISSKGLTFDHI